jgi:site-specific recombinase
VAYSLNYGLGFMLIHVLHLTIATKQPAMTAATLAGALDGRDSRESRLDALTELAAEVSRTQWISIAGNVAITMLTAFAIALTAAQFLGWHTAGPEKAAHLLHDLHPWKSLALLHAAIAGVYLFLSGLISGFYDNRALYHRVPQRLRRVKWLRALLGEARLAIARELRRAQPRRARRQFPVRLHARVHAGDWRAAGPAARHPPRRVRVGELRLRPGRPAVRGDAARSSCRWPRVLLIGLVNLMVSFSLALKVALRSRGITREQTEGLWGRVLRRFLAAPRDFFWPPAGEGVVGPETAR